MANIYPYGLVPVEAEVHADSFCGQVKKGAYSARSAVHFIYREPTLCSLAIKLGFAD